MLSRVFRRGMSVVASPLMGLMQDHPLLISSVIEYGSKTHGDAEVVSRLVENPDKFYRYTYKDVGHRSKQLASALQRLGVGVGDRVCTVAWNGHRHLELYFGVSGKGSVLHTVNPRLQPEQISYVINHAENKYVFVDLTFFSAIEKLLPTLKTVKGVVVMTDRHHMPPTNQDNVLCYEELLGAEKPEYEWPRMDERAASSICYTSGTTGLPKGVVYSHRSTVLHAISLCTVNGFNIGCHDVVLPVVPMFHVNAWSLPYACPIAGCKLVLPAMALDGPRLHSQLFNEKVTNTAGVPLIYGGLLQHMTTVGDSLPDLKRIYVGGAACPPNQIDAWERLGIRCMPAWGMTETSPLGVINYPTPVRTDEPAEARRQKSYVQGREVFGAELKIMDADLKELPRDGRTQGNLYIRGPWIASGYFKSDKKILEEGDWMDTGDVSTITSDGYMKIVDRAKDMVKSGGEWISSIDVENTAMAHPTIAMAAVIGIPHPKWDERPLLIVVPKPGQTVKKEDIQRFLGEKLIRSLYVPDDVVTVDAIPVGGTGKIIKKDLKERFMKHYENAA